MTDTQKMTGQCLCGGVQFTAENADINMGVCHCDMCRKHSSGPYFAVECKENVIFSGEDNITRFESSEWGQRGFCNTCGSTLFYFLKPKSYYMMAAGLFDDQSAFNFDHQIFIDEKPSYYCFSNETKNMTGQEVFESVSE